MKQRPDPWTLFDILKLLAIGFLLLPAAQRMAQDDYLFIRWMATLVAVYGAYRGFQGRRHLWGFLFLIPAVIFNPIARLHMAREGWVAVDLGTVGLLAASLTQKL